MVAKVAASAASVTWRPRGAAGEEENGSRRCNDRERPDDVGRDIGEIDPAEGARGPSCQSVTAKPGTQRSATTSGQK